MITGLGDSESTKEISVGFTLLGSPSANAEELGRGRSYETNTTFAVDFGKGKPVRDLSGNIIMGTTIDPKTLLTPEHQFIGIGGNAVLYNNAKITAPSVAEGALYEYSDSPAAFGIGEKGDYEVGFNDNIRKGAFDVLSSSLQAGFVALNYASNLNAYPMAAMNKPYNVHQYSPKDELKSLYELNSPK